MKSLVCDKRQSDISEKLIRDNLKRFEQNVNNKEMSFGLLVNKIFHIIYVWLNEIESEIRYLYCHYEAQIDHCNLNSK